MDVFDVTGAFDLALMDKELALSGKYDFITCIAFVVGGGIYRHDFVAKVLLKVSRVFDLIQVYRFHRSR